jgi:transcription initiation factor TFIIIB Brf1 subunit/transcription initiation factor TFIIB
MLYQVNYNRGYNTPVCATEYVHADSYKEAWVMGDCKAVYPEQVFDVYPINNHD